MVVTAVRAFLIDGYMAVVGVFRRTVGKHSQGAWATL